MRIARSEVEASATRLSEASSSWVRNDRTSFTRWLLFKSAGLTSTTPVRWTAEDLRAQMELWFAVPSSDGSNWSRYYIPWNVARSRWVGDTARSKYHIQSVQTAIKTGGNAVDMALYEVTDQGGGLFVTSIRSTSYLSALQRSYSSAPIPLQDLAVWRYRVAPLSATDDPVAMLEAELHLDVDEKSRVFR